VLDEYLAWLTIERGLQPGTIGTYRRHLDALAAFHAGRSLEELQTADLRRFLGRFSGQKPTVAQCIAALRSFYGFLVRAGHRADDPSAPLSRPKLQKNAPRPVEEHQLLDLPAKALLIAVFLVETGLRVGEAVALELDLPAPEDIVVRGKGDKERFVPLSPRAREAIEKLGGRIPWTVRHIERVFRRAGFNPHRLRATFATALGEAGVDAFVIQDLLGHASPQTTRSYLKNSQRRLSEGVRTGASQLPLSGVRLPDA
jgi:site-specific recombinase XerD